MECFKLVQGLSVVDLTSLTIFEILKSQVFPISSTTTSSHSSPLDPKKGVRLFQLERAFIPQYFKAIVL